MKRHSYRRALQVVQQQQPRNNHNESVMGNKLTKCSSLFINHQDGVEQVEKEEEETRSPSSLVALLPARLPSVLTKNDSNLACLSNKSCDEKASKKSSSFFFSLAADVKEGRVTNEEVGRKSTTLATTTTTMLSSTAACVNTTVASAGDDDDDDDAPFSSLTDHVTPNNRQRHFLPVPHCIRRSSSAPTRFLSSSSPPDDDDDKKATRLENVPKEGVVPRQHSSQQTGEASCSSSNDDDVMNLAPSSKESGSTTTTQPAATPASSLEEDDNSGSTGSRSNQQQNAKRAPEPPPLSLGLPTRKALLLCSEPPHKVKQQQEPQLGVEKAGGSTVSQRPRRSSSTRMRFLPAKNDDDGQAARRVANGVLPRQQPQKGGGCSSNLEQFVVSSKTTGPAGPAKDEDENGENHGSSQQPEAEILSPKDPLSSGHPKARKVASPPPCPAPPQQMQQQPQHELKRVKTICSDDPVPQQLARDKKTKNHHNKRKRKDGHVSAAFSCVGSVTWYCPVPTGATNKDVDHDRTMHPKHYQTIHFGLVEEEHFEESPFTRLRDPWHRDAAEAKRRSARQWHSLEWFDGSEAEAPSSLAGCVIASSIVEEDVKCDLATGEKEEGTRTQQEEGGIPSADEAVSRSSRRRKLCRGGHNQSPLAVATQQPAATTASHSSLLPKERPIPASPKPSSCTTTGTLPRAQQSVALLTLKEEEDGPYGVGAFLSTTTPNGGIDTDKNGASSSCAPPPPLKEPAPPSQPPKTWRVESQERSIVEEVEESKKRCTRTANISPGAVPASITVPAPITLNGGDQRCAFSSSRKDASVGNLSKHTKTTPRRLPLPQSDGCQAQSSTDTRQRQQTQPPAQRAHNSDCGMINAITLLAQQELLHLEQETRDSQSVRQPPTPTATAASASVVVNMNAKSESEIPSRTKPSLSQGAKMGEENSVCPSQSTETASARSGKRSRQSSGEESTSSSSLESDAAERSGKSPKLEEGTSNRRKQRQSRKKQAVLVPKRETRSSKHKRILYEDATSSRVGSKYQAMNLPMAGEYHGTTTTTPTGEGDVLWDPVKANEAGKAGDLAAYVMKRGLSLPASMKLLESLHRTNYEPRLALSEFGRASSQDQDDNANEAPVSEEDKKTLEVCFAEQVQAKQKNFNALAKKTGYAVQQVLHCYYEWKGKDGGKLYKAVKPVKLDGDQKDDGSATGESCSSSSFSSSSVGSGACAICRDGGTLVLCDGMCHRSFHLKCVGLPKDQVPHGDWFCRQCASKQSPKKLSSRRSPKKVQAATVVPKKESPSARTKRQVRKVARTTKSAPPPSGKNNSNRKKQTRKQAGSAKSPALPTTDTVSSASMDVDESSVASEYEDYFCEVCGGGGRLLVCDGCEKGHHLDCVTPKLHEVPDGKWFCRVCSSKSNIDSKDPNRSTDEMAADTAVSQHSRNKKDEGDTTSNGRDESHQSTREIACSPMATSERSTNEAQWKTTETDVVDSRATNDGATLGKESSCDSRGSLIINQAFAVNVTLEVVSGKSSPSQTDTGEESIASNQGNVDSESSMSGSHPHQRASEQRGFESQSPLDENTHGQQQPIFRIVGKTRRQAYGGNPMMKSAVPKDASTERDYVDTTTRPSFYHPTAERGLRTGNDPSLPRNMQEEWSNWHAAYGERVSTPAAAAPHYTSAQPHHPYQYVRQDIGAPTDARYQQQLQYARAASSHPAMVAPANFQYGSPHVAVASSVPWSQQYPLVVVNGGSFAQQDHQHYPHHPHYYSHSTSVHPSHGWHVAVGHGQGAVAHNNARLHPAWYSQNNA